MTKNLLIQKFKWLYIVEHFLKKILFSFKLHFAGISKQKEHTNRGERIKCIENVCQRLPNQHAQVSHLRRHKAAHHAHIRREENGRGAYFGRVEERIVNVARVEYGRGGRFGQASK